MADKTEIPVSEAAADILRERRWAGIVFHELEQLDPANSHKKDVISESAAYNPLPPPREGQTEESVQDVTSDLKSEVTRLVATQRSQLTSLDNAKTEHVILTALAAAAAGNSASIDALFRAAKIETAIPQPEIVSLSPADAEAFFAFASAEENQWSKSSGVLPSAFIAEKFAPWLGRGLGLRDVRKAQPTLAGKYSLEVNDKPENRVEGLYVKPHQLPAGTPPRLQVTKRVTDLSEEGKARRRKQEREKKARLRAKPLANPKGPR